MFELTANVVRGEDEGKEGGGWLIFPIGVFKVALDAHEVSEADEAAGWNDMFPIDLTKVGLAHPVDEPSEVTRGFNIIFHFRLLVMVWDDGIGCICAEGVHWWTADGHNTRAGSTG